MENLLTVFFVLQIIISILLIGIVIVQKTSDDSLSGIGGGMSNDGIISKRAVAGILTKGSMILVTLFMLNSLFLGTVISRRAGNNESRIENFVEEQKITDEGEGGTIQIPEEE